MGNHSLNISYALKIALGLSYVESNLVAHKNNFALGPTFWKKESIFVSLHVCIYLCTFIAMCILSNSKVVIAQWVGMTD